MGIYLDSANRARRRPIVNADLVIAAHLLPDRLRVLTNWSEAVTLLAFRAFQLRCNAYPARLSICR